MIWQKSQGARCTRPSFNSKRRGALHALRFQQQAQGRVARAPVSTASVGARCTRPNCSTNHFDSRMQTKRRCTAPPYKTYFATTANYMLFSKCRFFVRSFFLLAQSKHLQQSVCTRRRLLFGLLRLRRRNFVAASGANVLVRLNSKLTTRTQVIKHFSRPLSLIRV